MTLISPHDTALGPNVTVVIPAGRGGSQSFWFAKRLFDIGFSLLLLPLVGAVCLALVLLNPQFGPAVLPTAPHGQGLPGLHGDQVSHHAVRYGAARP